MNKNEQITQDVTPPNGPSSTTAGEIPEMSVADNRRNSEIFAQTHDEAVRCSALLGCTFKYLDELTEQEWQGIWPRNPAKS